jgi:hypothetical protein
LPHHATARPAAIVGAEDSNLGVGLCLPVALQAGPRLALP